MRRVEAAGGWGCWLHAAAGAAALQLKGLVERCRHGAYVLSEMASMRKMKEKIWYFAEGPSASH